MERMGEMLGAGEEKDKNVQDNFEDFLRCVLTMRELAYGNFC